MLDELIAAWRAGAQAHRIVWLLFWGERARGYAAARAMGLRDADLVSAVRRGIFLRDYMTVRRQASHPEVLEAHAATGDAFAYACQRRAGHGHAEALEQLRPGGRHGDPSSATEAPEPRTGPSAGPARLRPRTSVPSVGIELGTTG